MLERALTQPQQYSVDPLKNAQNWGIPIWATNKLQSWLDKIYASLKGTYNLKQIQQPSKDPKIRQLKAPYIKFESFQRDTRPIFLELPAWPKLNFEGEPGSCPFDVNRREKKEITISSKDIKENTKDLIVKQQDKVKDMTRRPRGGATRTRRTEQLVAGYCEICRIDYRDLKKHLRSDQHLNFVRNDDNFLSLDTLINAGASVEAFLKFKRSKDIQKDCSLFPNVGRSLRSVVLPEEKVDVKESKPDLDNYSTGDIDMVQCNGARRNLDIKLNPSHNLRTRAKHESGHLLRSKGSPWHEVDKSDKLYDKFEGFTIKKRAKGTIWIEEDDPDEKCVNEGNFKVNEDQEYNEKCSLDNCNDPNSKGKECETANSRHNDQPSLAFKDIKCEINSVLELSCLANPCVVEAEEKCLNTTEKISNENQIPAPAVPEVLLNGEDSRIDDKNLKANKNIHPKESSDSVHRHLKFSKIPTASETSQIDSKQLNGSSVSHTNEIPNEPKDSVPPSLTEKETKDEQPRTIKTSRRGARTSRGRNRLSVEERLIEDNRAYYKVEVLGNKLRSSTIPSSLHSVPVKIDDDAPKKDDAPSSEKPVVVRFKRVRKSELSLLSDEAESFMFGEPKRDETSDCGESDQQSSVVPNDTESERDVTDTSYIPSSIINSSSSVCDETNEEDSQDSISSGRARKRRRTQAEALIKDNTDYYKFQVPGSRLRYQAPLTGVKDSQQGLCSDVNKVEAVDSNIESTETLFSAKPSPEVEKLQFSFEAVPKSEPWYQTYQRQDKGAEFWHCFSEGDNQKPFLLPYEIENFHETLARGFNRSDGNRKRGRGRGGGGIGRSPRKSPRCHASTLAIMSTIIRKKEQLQSTNLSIIEEEAQYVRSRTNTPKPEAKYEVKSEADDDLKEIARNIDDMLCGKHFLGLEDSFEPPELGTSIELNLVHPHIPKGPPPDLLELLDNCQEITCLDNSSCASSECGEVTSTESPLKRRKRRKNRTGWPGIKMRKKLQSKQSTDVECERENVPDKKIDDRLSENSDDKNISSRLEGNLNLIIAESNSNRLIQGDGADDDRATEDLMDRIQSSSAKSTDSSSSGISPGNVKNENSSKKHRNIEDTAKSLSKNSENTDDSTHREISITKTNKDLSQHTEETTEGDKNLQSHEYSYICNPQTTVSKKQLHSTNATSRKLQRRSISTSDYKNYSIDEEGPDSNLGNESHSVAASRKQPNSHNISRRRQNEDVLSDTHGSDTEGENHVNSCRKDGNSVTNFRTQQVSNNLSKRRAYKEMSSETLSSDLKDDNSENSYSKETPPIIILQKQSNTNSVSRKRQRDEMSSSDVNNSGFEDENSCKKDTNLNITSKKQQNSRKRHHKETVSSEARDSDIEFTFSVSHRVSPVVSSVELENRRSSIEFQPVVRMTKIDDQVDMDNGVLSVTVASNRRLRSSTSPRSNLQPPPKRFRNAKGKFGRWIKNS
ncbi:uncharacterized protein LOC105692528 isoform X2 [Athalia rosae]|nr:uncharacterized protein LOC105692528 isoform X2 [Athalia rosae]